MLVRRTLEYRNGQGEQPTGKSAPVEGRSEYAVRVKAGKYRTYFFDVKVSNRNDRYIAITESKRQRDGGGYERRKLYIYPEDFDKFVHALQNTIAYIDEQPELTSETSEPYHIESQHKTALTDAPEATAAETKRTAPTNEEFISPDDPPTPPAQRIEDEEADLLWD